MVDTENVMRLSYKEYVEMAKTYSIRIKSHFTPPLPPTYYARVGRKEDGELVAWMWLDQAREQWCLFSPDDATEEIEELFGV